MEPNSSFLTITVTQEKKHGTFQMVKNKSKSDNDLRTVEPAVAASAQKRHLGLRQEDLGVVHDLGGKPGQARDLQSEALVRAAGPDVVEQLQPQMIAT